MKVFEMLFRPFRKIFGKSTRSDSSSPAKTEKRVRYRDDLEYKYAACVNRPRTVFSKEEAGAVRCTRIKFYPEDIEKMEKLPLEERVEFKLKL
jgi:hypothetical protein